MAVSRSGVIVSIPRPLTALIGREQEITHLYHLLRSDAALVSVTGAGGVGKTRLALQAALELEPVFDAGAIFVPLASVTRGSSIPLAIARTVGLDESSSSISGLAAALGEQSRLLVLDNLEQIPDAAVYVMQLRAAMSQLKILVTSRFRLELGGEHVLPLEPLETESGNARSLPSVQLFIERAKAISPSMPTDDEAVSLIADICQKLDGIPLAIELAAARLAIFSLTDLHAQLENILPVLASNRFDMPDRQRTMRNAIAWTYELLDASERRLFTWLSVYEQDFSLDSIRHVVHQLELTNDPLDIVHFLVSRSLIRPSRREAKSPRYQMLQMLREFGHEQLLASNEDQLARRSHAMDMVALSERAEPNLITSESAKWMRALNDDLPNILLALEWSKASSDDGIGPRIFGSIWRFAHTYQYSGRFRALAPDLSDDTIDARTRAKALIGIGHFCHQQMDLDEARHHFTTALELTKDVPDKVVQVRALHGLGHVTLDLRDVAQAQDYYSQALQLAESIGDLRGQIAAMSMLRNIVHQMNDYDQDIAMSEKLVELSEREGHLSARAREYGNLGLAYLTGNRLDDAEKALMKALEYGKPAGDIGSIGVTYVNLASLHLTAGRLDRCREHLELGLAFAREHNLRLHEAVLLHGFGLLYIQAQDFGAAAGFFSQSAKLLDNDAMLTHLLDVGSGMSEACAGVGLLPEAAEILGAVLAMRDRFNLLADEERGAAEVSVLAALDIEQEPELAELIERGAAYDRQALQNRIQNVASSVVTTCPPRRIVPEREERRAYSLSPRETEVLGMVAAGMSNAEIAEEMFVSPRTVTTHLSNIFTKLDVNNRSRAVAVATAAGLV